MIKSKFKKLIAALSAASMIIASLPAMAAVDLPEGSIPNEPEVLVPGNTYTSTELWVEEEQQNISFDSQSGDIVLEHTLTINTPLAEGTYDNNTGVNGITSNARKTKDSFYIVLESDAKRGRVGAAFMAKSYDAASNTQSFCWKSGDDTAGTFYTYDSATGASTSTEMRLNIGETYTMRYEITNVGNGQGAGLVLTIFDGADSIVSRSTLDMRNFTSDTDGKKNSLNRFGVQMKAREAGTEASVTIGDLKKIVTVPDSMEVTMDGTELSTDTPKELTFSLASDNKYSLAAKSLNGTTDMSEDFPITLGLENAPEEVTIDGENNLVIASSIAPAEEPYEFNITAVVTGYNDTMLRFPVSLTVDEATPEEVVEAVANSLDIANGTTCVFVEGDGTYDVTDVFELPAIANPDVSVEWSAWQKLKTEGDDAWVTSDQIVIDGRTVTPDADPVIGDHPLEDYDIALRAVVTYTGEDADTPVTKTVNFMLNLQAMVELTVNYVSEDGEVIKTKTVSLPLGESYTETELDNIEYNGNTYKKSKNAVISIDSVAENDVLEIAFEQILQDVFLDESFDDLASGSTWGFTNNTTVSVSNGELTLCDTDESGSEYKGASDEKTFKGETFADQERLEVSFKWKTNVDFGATTGRYSWFSLRDTNGTPILVITGGANNSKMPVQPYIAYGFSESDTKTGFTRISNPVQSEFYTFNLSLDFAGGTMSGTILAPDGSVAANIAERELTAENLGGLKAHHGYSASAMVIDDFRVLSPVKQKVTFEVTDEATSEPLEGAEVSVGGQNVVTGADGTAEVILVSNDTYSATVMRAPYGTVTLDNIVVEDYNKTVSVAMERLSDEDYVADAVEHINITGDAVTQSGSTYTITGDFDLYAPAGANVEWTTDAPDGQVVINGTDALVYPQEGKATIVVLTAKVTQGEASDSKTFTLDLVDYLNTVTGAVEAVADETVYPYDDQDGTYGMTDVYSLSAFTAENPLSFDLYLPSAANGADTHISQTWESSDAENFAIDDEKGTITVGDEEAHEVTLARTVSYIKNGVTLASREMTYPITVQFAHNDVDDRVDAWAAAYAATQDAESTTSDKYTTAYNQVYNTFMKQYQLRLDAACEANFSNMPDEGTNISTSGISDLNYEGVFGSSIEWTSSQSTYASVSQSNRRVTVNRSSFSGTRDISITATLYLPSYTETETRAFSYEITGTRSTGNGGSPSGSVSNPGGGITVPIVTPTATPTATRTPASEAFDDIEGVESWAGDAIRALYDEGIISGKGDNKFAPYDNVTRGEFAKMIVGAFDLNEMPDEYRGFTDVPSGNWCFTYVEIAAAAGVVNGYEDGSFGLNDYITRQDMAVMVVRAAEAAGVTITDNGNSADFGDADSIADYAASAVDSLVRAGIINGIDGNFEPVSNANRAQAAKILANFIG